LSLFDNAKRVSYQVRLVRRDNGAKIDVPMAGLVEKVQEILTSIHENLFNTAKVKRDACIEVVHTWDEFMTALNNKKLILAPWCDEEVYPLSLSLSLSLFLSLVFLFFFCYSYSCI
jgi:prolyl-tRNA synthetase